MYNLIKMELYKLFKSASMWILLLSLLLFGFFSAYITGYDLKEMSYNEEYIQNSAELEERFNDPSKVEVGVYFRTDPKWSEGNVNLLEYMLVMLQSGIYLVFISIFTALFVNSEVKNGYIKNIAGQIKFKGMLVFSKLPALLVFNIIAFIGAYLTNAVFIKLFLGDVDFGITAELLKLILLQFLLHFAFSCIVMVLTMVTKSKAAGIAFGIIFSAGLGALLFMGIDTVLHSMGVSETFNIAEYAIEQNVKLVGLGFNFDDTAKILLLVSLVIIASSQIAMVVANNRDVR